MTTPSDDKYLKYEKLKAVRKPSLLTIIGLCYLLSMAYIYFDHPATATTKNRRNAVTEEQQMEGSHTKPSKFYPRPSDDDDEEESDVEEEEVEAVIVEKTWLEVKSIRPGFSDEEWQGKIKNMMKHAWVNYERYAWGRDELRPLSKTGRNWLESQTIGATIVDSLDTLWIMGMMSEYEKARDYVLNELTFDIDAFTSVFETNIRVVGGLIAATELSNDKRYLKKAIDIADRLLPAFNTPTGIPDGAVNLRTGQSRHQSWAIGAILAEFGSMQLEFQRLSELTGDPKYKDAALKVIDKVVAMTKPIAGLYPTALNNRDGNWIDGAYTVGALADSFYEYLLKLWLISDMQDEKYRKLYDESAAAIREHLVGVTEHGNMYLGIKSNGHLSNDMEHLACFGGGMFALGAISNQKDTKWEEMYEIGANITQTCYRMYQSQKLGLSAEKTRITDWQATVNYYILRPEVVESIFYMWRFTHDEKYREWGREIASSIEKWCRLEAGYAGISNIQQQPPVYNDNQESFFLAETLKYLYLLFSDDDLISLDEYVFNTEAHPLKVKRTEEPPSN